MCYNSAMIKSILFILIITFLCPFAKADKTDDYVLKEMKKRHLPGISIAVIRNGKILKVKGYGVQDEKTGKPADSRTLYEIGSVGKTFVAVGILMLVERGRLKLTDPISRYIAETPKTWKSITIRHLLSHTSGIKDYVTEIPRSEEKQEWSSADVYHRAASTPLNFKPGEKYGYSHTNYVVLGMILGNRGGKPFDKFLEEELFKTLEMTDTQPKEQVSESPNLAMGYRLVEDKTQEAVREEGKFADQYLVSSASDLAKWAVALDNGTVLTAENRELMWTPTPLTEGKSAIYGLGWNTESMNGHRVVGHSGSVGGFSANLTRFPDDKLSIIVLTNQRDTSSFQLIRGIASLYKPALAK